MPRRTPRGQRAAAPSPSCPCGLPAAYRDCCGRLHRGSAEAATAEQLMRARFSAFAVRDEPFLLRSWHPSTRPAGVPFDPATRWTGLEIIGCGAGSSFHTEGTVEFKARYTERGRAGELHENSRFVRHDGRWCYLDGVVGGGPATDRLPG